MRALMLPVRELLFLVRQLPAGMAALRGFQLPRRRFLVPGPSLFRFSLDHLEESRRRGCMNLAVQSFLAGTATADHVLHRQGLRGDGTELADKPTARLVQEVTPSAGDLGVQSGQMLDCLAEIG